MYPIKRIVFWHYTVVPFCCRKQKWGRMGKISFIYQLSDSTKFALAVGAANHKPELLSKTIWDFPPLSRARICKHLWSPGIGLRNRFRPAGNRFLGSLKGLQITAFVERDKKQTIINLRVQILKKVISDYDFLSKEIWDSV